MAIQKITTDIIEDNAVTGSKISVGTPAAGDILYYDGTDYVKLAKGADGEVLKLESGLPAWGASSGGSPSSGGSGGGGPSDAFIIAGGRGGVQSDDIANYSFTTSTESVWGQCSSNNGAGGGPSSGCSNSSTTHGYYTTGTIPNPSNPSSPTFATNIDEYSYASEGNSTNIGNINQHKTSAGGVNSSTEGYVLGGTGFNITGHSSNGQKFAFSNGSSSTNVMSLEIGKAGMGTHQDSTHGYTFGGVSGGGNNPVVTAVSSCCRFSFANDATREDIGALNEISAGHATVGNATTAYHAGGNSASNQGNTVFYTRIDSYTLASSSTAADHGDLDVVQNAAYGASTNTTGLVVGGSSASVNMANKQEFSYASNTTATQNTALTSTASGGGHGQVPPTFQYYVVYYGKEYMEVIDNAINDDELNIIQEIMLGKAFPWFFNNNTIDPDTVSGVNDFQFTHIFYSTVDGCGYNESNYFNILKPIIKKLECRVLIRAKANLRTVAPEKDMIAGWHRDYETNNTQTAIFYVNSNNGYTIFKESKEKVESVENRLVVFPTNLEHCGVSCTDNNQRVVINFNFIGQEL